eukprot:4419786-Pyramimonas_sp.AAC.1
MVAGWVSWVPGSRVPGYWFRVDFGGFRVPGLPGSRSIISAKTIYFFFGVGGGGGRGGGGQGWGRTS